MASAIATAAFASQVRSARGAGDNDNDSVSDTDSVLATFITKKDLIILGVFILLFMVCLILMLHAIHIVLKQLTQLKLAERIRERERKNS